MVENLALGALSILERGRSGLFRRTHLTFSYAMLTSLVYFFRLRNTSVPPLAGVSSVGCSPLRFGLNEIINHFKRSKSRGKSKEQFS